jgi:hypothetical protein
LASAAPLEQAFPVLSWIIENANTRLAKASDGRVVLREMYDASITSCDLIAAIGSRRQGVRRPSTIPVSLDQPTKIFLHSGERSRALDYLRRWLESYADSFLQICDPWFGVRDLEALSIVLAVAPSLKVTILTSKKQQEDDGIQSNYQTAYRDYWRKHFSDQEPPQTELAIVGTQATQELPIHDRWWLTRGAGIRLGTSFNSLGIKGGTEISVLTETEVLERSGEADQYLQRLKREHLGQKLTFSFTSL